MEITMTYSRFDIFKLIEDTVHNLINQIENAVCQIQKKVQQIVRLWMHNEKMYICINDYVRPSVWNCMRWTLYRFRCETSGKRKKVRINFGLLCNTSMGVQGGGQRSFAPLFGHFTRISQKDFISINIRPLPFWVSLYAPEHKLIGWN